MTDLQARAALAGAVAVEAGALLMRHLGRLDGYDRKGAVELVSAADRESQDLIVARVRAAFPGDAVLAEEGADLPGTSGFRWIVDPLDGTTNFVHSHPAFAVSIGLDLHGDLVAGVVHAPALGETFAAVRGGGATLNGEPIRVSRTAVLDDALLASGFPYYRRQAVDRLLSLVARAILAAQGFRRMGSAALDLCWLAAGRLDGYFEEGLLPWDVAGGIVVLREAGGVVTGFDGGPFELASGRILASNGLIHPELREALFGHS